MSRAQATCPPRPPAGLPSAAAVGAALEALLARRERAVLDGDARRAAVLLVLYDDGGRPYLVLTKRTETVAHPGQISLPGGSLEPDDPSLCAAAVRETEEEIGVPGSALRVVGALDDVHTMASGFAITPFVAVLEGAFSPTPSDDEVALVIEIPVADLLEADARLPDDLAPLELRYPLADEDVWGATARILRNFARLTRCALAPGGLSPPAPGR